MLLYSYIQAMQCAEFFSSEGFMKKHGASCQPKGTNLITLLSLYINKQKSGDSVLWYHNHSLHKSFFFFQINQTGTFGRGGRTNIAVPAQGIVDIRNALSEVLEEYGSEEGL